MKQLARFFLAGILLAGCSHVAPPSEVIKSGCGPYPVQYQAMIMDFVSSQLNFPDAEIDMLLVRLPAKTAIDAD